MVRNKICLTPIVSKSASPHNYCFKVCYRDPVELRLIKQELQDVLKARGFDVELVSGWHDDD